MKRGYNETIDKSDLFEISESENRSENRESNSQMELKRCEEIKNLFRWGDILKCSEPDF